MISHLRGTVSAAGPTWVVLDIGGFGMKVNCPPATAATARPGSEMTLETSLVVREDSLTLHGFATSEDRDAFELVQTASGVGPKLAMAMLSVLSADELAAALSGEDAATLCRVPGIGKKGAAKAHPRAEGPRRAALLRPIARPERTLIGPRIAAVARTGGRRADRPGMVEPGRRGSGRLGGRDAPGGSRGLDRGADAGGAAQPGLTTSGECRTVGADDYRDLQNLIHRT
jgi:hypothetical protein